MRMKGRRFSIATAALALCLPAAGQSLSVASQAAGSPVPATLPVEPASPAVQILRDFKETDVKFNLAGLMGTLRDRRHEGWVLAAYPDPKTGRPLIGAGFSLDLPAREHLQRDPLNPHPFLEPSSADLWQAAGLEPQKLQNILSRFQERLTTWNTRRYRSRIGDLEPEITSDDADLLLRISAIQSIYNARAYCRNFDQLTASQQMALSQLVYQMGVNLEEFGQFLNLVNNGSSSASIGNAAYWHSVQESLMQSQWARLYRTRAVAVIAMLDPEYSDGTGAAERRIGAVLRPAVAHRHRGRAGASRELASVASHQGRAGRGKASRSRSKRKA